MLYIPLPNDEKNFIAIELMYNEIGYKVVNPYRSGVTLANNIRDRIKLLLSCDAILVLPMHMHDTYTKNEIQIALLTGIELLPLKNYDIEKFMQLIISSLKQISWQEITCRSRKRNIVDIRRVLAVYLRNYYGLSLNDIGKILHRDHSDVVYLLKTHNAVLETDSEYRSLYNTLTQNIFQTACYEQK